MDLDQQQFLSDILQLCTGRLVPCLGIRWELLYLGRNQVGRLAGMKNLVSHIIPPILILLLFTAKAWSTGGTLLTIETIREARDVQVRLFDKETGLPALELRYDEIHRSRPRIGPLQLNFHIMRVEKLRVSLDLDRPSCNALNLQLNQLMASKPIRFIYAGPMELVAKRGGAEVIRIESGRVKIHRDGGVYLYRGVNWKTQETTGKLNDARLQTSENGKAWVLKTVKLEPIAELRFGS